MVSDGSSAFNFAPAAEHSFATLQVEGQIHQGQQQLPPWFDPREWGGYMSNDNDLVQFVQDGIRALDLGAAYTPVPGPARPGNLAPVGFRPSGTHQQLNPQFINYGTPYNLPAYNNRPAWPPGGEAVVDDGYSPFAFDGPVQGHSPATTTPSLSTVSSPASLALSSPPASSPSTSAGRERPYKCPHCPRERRFTSARDLRRHESTSHRNEQTRIYICWCGGRGSREPRKDNHKRHVRSCNMQSLVFPVPSYTCICGQVNFGRDVHLHHVDNCGRTRTHRHHSTRNPGAP